MPLTYILEAESFCPITVATKCVGIDKLAVTGDTEMILLAATMAILTDMLATTVRTEHRQVSSRKGLTSFQDDYER